METTGIMFRDKSSSHFRKLNWQFLTFWILYIGLIFTIGYALI